MSEASDQRIMPETRVKFVPASSVYPRIGISLSASMTDERFYLFFMEFAPTILYCVNLRIFKTAEHTNYNLKEFLQDRG